MHYSVALPKRLDREFGPKVLKHFDTIIFDCDGVLWRGKKVIPGVIETLHKLRLMGKRLFFITNNSTKSRLQIEAKFLKLGIKVKLDEIIGSAFLAAAHLKNDSSSSSSSSSIAWDNSKEVYVIGRKGIIQELGLVGIKAFGGNEDDGKEFDFEAELPDEDRSVGAVIVGFDQGFNYTKLAKAQHYLRNPECLFIATNTDNSYPDSRYVLPGTGCIVSAIQAASARTPVTIGKPSPKAFEILKGLHSNLDPNRTLMIGDKIETDILFGLYCGLQTLLVETGVNKEVDTLAHPQEERPHYVASSITIFMGEGNESDT